MRNIIFCIMVLLASASIHADDLTANLKMRDGTVRQFIMNSSSEIELQKSLLKVHAPVNPEYDVLFLLEDVSTLTFDSSVTGIQNLSEAVLSYRLDGDMLTISGITDCPFVKVYDLSGVLLSSVRVHEGSCILSLASLPKGMLLIKVNSQTIKILKR
ncbi:T9SS type A sorting domain-containing protein [Bacteroides sp. OF04-15BH]|mgnify:CR=1 FL=1|uniref:T9SS type A sorting domain-containing protein n=1 Tax=Bacteroides sp. OF04-15BH TaxID=2292281 RepID=UPI0011C45015|nr:T9SS type A sorting domain-containing protein [Bacteroides sp. OF04-15BH]